MSEKLTPAQRQVVENRGGPLLVAAAAGSGKTKVLVDRLLRYIQDPVDGANIDDFLIITYTKAAAAELRGKIAAKLTQTLAKEPENRHLQRQLQRLYLAKISTVHAFCADLLREYAYKLDLTGDFSMIDESQADLLRQSVLTELLEEAYAQAGSDPSFCAFVDSQGFGRNDSAVEEIILQVYDKSRCHLRPEAYLSRCLSLPQDGTDASETVYGELVLAQLHTWLDLQLQAMERTVALTQGEEGMEKPAVLLESTLSQLRNLRSCHTWEETRARMDVDFGVLRFSAKTKDSPVAATVKALRDACKKGLGKYTKAFSDSSAQILLDLQETSPALEGLIGLVRQFGKAYAAAKKRRHLLDFSDLEHLTLDLLLGVSRSGSTQVAKEVAGRFREVLVDEYQDSNAVQDAIFRCLTKESGNCFMVGDVKQSIYQFRLADPQIFLDKYEAFPPAGEEGPGEGRKILLRHNFRSGGAVLEGANDVFRLWMSREVGDLAYTQEECLQEGIPHLPLGEPEVELAAIEVQDDTYLEEAAYVAKRICQLLDGTHKVRQGDQLRPIMPQDIAILLRSPNSVGSYFQQALESAGVRCTSGQGSDLFAADEIQALISLLTVIDNPRQDIPLLAVLASPVFGFTADDLAAVRGSGKEGLFFDALERSSLPKARTFLEQLHSLRFFARRGSIPALLEQIFLVTRLDSIYAAKEDGEQRLENLYTFFQLAAQQDAVADLGGFLEHLRLLREKGLVGAAPQMGGAVQLLSIHKSKGLEYPVVFLCGLSRGFNKESQRAAVLCHRDLGLGISAVDQENRVRYPTLAKRAIAMKMGRESLSEEMRVLYVAMTRAKDRLIMTYASDSLEDQITDLALRLPDTPRPLLSMEVPNPGTWILMTALHRSEAGALFALGGNPGLGQVQEHPWRITVERAVQVQQAVAQERKEQEGPEEAYLRHVMSFRYPHVLATQTPSKQTATDRKGRQKDEEAAQDAPQPVLHSWRKPSFLGGGSSDSGVNFGNAMHRAMAGLPYKVYSSVQEVEEEARKLADCGYLTQEELGRLRYSMLWQFFQTELARRFSQGKQLLREFKFSLLCPAPQLEGEEILLQGVVDCALVEEDGLVVVDFKTDYVEQGALDAKAEAYRAQVLTYADALQRMFQRPVKEKYLYFFRTGQLVAL